MATTNEDSNELAIELPDRTLELDGVEHFQVASMREYHADRTAESRSSLNLFLKNRHAYWHRRVAGTTADEASSVAASLGTAFEELLLRPETFETRVRVLELKPQSDAMKDARAACDQPTSPYVAAITDTQLESAKRMIESVRSCPAAMELLERGHMLQEHTLRFYYPGTDFLLKCAFDCLWLEDGMFADIKTARDPSEDGFAQAMFDRGYDLQAALYSLGRDLYLGGGPTPQFIVVGNEPPYSCAVYPIGPRTLEVAQVTLEKLVHRLRELRDFGIEEADWCGPGHSEPHTIELAPWQLRKRLNAI